VLHVLLHKLLRLLLLPLQLPASFLALQAPVRESKVLAASQPFSAALFLSN
jgi:hypothetical protein